MQPVVLMGTGQTFWVAGATLRNGAAYDSVLALWCASRMCGETCAMTSVRVCWRDSRSNSACACDSAMYKADKCRTHLQKERELVHPVRYVHERVGLCSPGARTNAVLERHERLVGLARLVHELARMVLRVVVSLRARQTMIRQKELRSRRSARTRQGQSVRHPAAAGYGS